LALDIGTTTVAALLIDLASNKILAENSRLNSQICYGADVINRIIESSKPGGLMRLHNILYKDTLIPMINELVNIYCPHL
jgi:uncharacterized 2Fe-2S/4Fe-4S cluster protein (DUF4445 family)